MRELAVLAFVTVDGVMQAPHDADEDLSGGFPHGGWALGCWDEVMSQVAQEAMAVPYDLLLGRATYDSFATAHATSGDSAGQDPMTAATKYVVTSDPETLGWENSVALTGSVLDEVVALKEQDGPLLQVHGSWQLLQALVSHELVDEYRIWTFPVLVGGGKRLFQHPGALKALRLRKAAPAGEGGATMAIYRRR